MNIYISLQHNISLHDELLARTFQEVAAIDIQLIQKDSKAAHSSWKPETKDIVHFLETCHAQQ